MPECLLILQISPTIFGASPGSKLSGFWQLPSYFDFFFDIKRVQYLCSRNVRENCTEVFFGYSRTTLSTSQHEPIGKTILPALGGTKSPLLFQDDFNQKNCGQNITRTENWVWPMSQLHVSLRCLTIWERSETHALNKLNS